MPQPQASNDPPTSDLPPPLPPDGATPPDNAPLTLPTLKPNSKGPFTPPGMPLTVAESDAARRLEKPPGPTNAATPPNILKETLHRRDPARQRDTKELPPPTGGKTDYIRKSLLGRGQYGEVFLAEAPGGVPCAVKRILRPLDDEASKREIESLELIKTLVHPYLLTVHAYWIEDDRLCIAMDLAEGSLLDRFKECERAGQPGIPADELVEFFQQAGEALDYLHERNVMHLDVKPANLMRVAGIAKVADFGLARAQKSPLDQTIRLSGTPQYMAPEIWQGNISFHSDQYSLAITYVEMRTGHTAFTGRDIFHMGRMHLEAEPALEGLTPAEQKVVRKALAKDPDHRYASCSEFAEALAQAFAPPRPASAPPSIWRTVAALLLFAAAACGAIYFDRMRRIEPPDRPPPITEVKPTPQANIWLPPGFRRSGDSPTVSADGQELYAEIVSETRPDLVLLLIPRRSEDDPPTFYIARDKVTVDQFSFAWNNGMKDYLEKYKAFPEAIPGKWRQHDLDDPRGRLMPIRDVTITEADCFAEWLNGPVAAGHRRSCRLPSTREWDKAAGRSLPEDKRYGPLWGQWDGTLKIGIKPWTDLDMGKKCTPLAIGESNDVAPTGCRDMAGNCREFTRTLDGNSQVPLPQPDGQELVYVRGAGYATRKPFSFLAREYSIGYNFCEHDLSFRVVFIVPPPQSKDVR